MALDFAGTLAAAGPVLFRGQRRVDLLARRNIPAPVVGGLPVALGITLLRSLGRGGSSYNLPFAPRTTHAEPAQLQEDDWTRTC
jgi:sodium--glutamate symport carrier gltS